MGKHIKACLWCRTKALMSSNQNFCTRDCAEKFGKIKNHIGNLPFEFDTATQIAKLEQQGQDYELPQQRSE